MKSYIYRMQDERGALYEKLIKLDSYLKNYGKKLSYAERYLMNEQQAVMEKYLDILDARIEVAVMKESKPDETDLQRSLDERGEVKWIDAKEDVPEDNYEVLVLVKSYTYNNYYYSVGSCYQGCWDWKVEEDYEEIADPDCSEYVVAWAELPKAPAKYDKLAHQQ